MCLHTRLSTNKHRKNYEKKKITTLMCIAVTVSGKDDP